MGIRTVMVTGDNRLTAAKIAEEAGVDDFLAEATPERKMELIRAEQAEGRLVAMTGDGTNDAPALAQADVGVAMNTGTQAAREAGNMVDLDSNPTKLIEIVEVGKQLLITRGALTTFSIANDVAKYFAILPAIFAATYAAAGESTGPLDELNIMDLGTPQSAIISAIVFNALVIPLLVPLALRGVRYRPVGATALLRRNLLIYGLGGLIAPFVGIKLIDLSSTTCSGRVATGTTRGPTSRSSSAWPPASARPTACSQEGHAELEAGRDVVIGLLETHGRAETAARRRRARGRRRAGASTYRDTTLEEMDLPGVLARAPELVPDRRARAHQRAGRRARQALRGHRGPARRRASTCSPRSTSSTSSRSTTRRRADGRARARDGPRRGAQARRRGRPDRPHARGAAGAPARGQGLPARARRRGANGFFRIENLAALREVALRQVAEEVEAKRLASSRSRDETSRPTRRRRSASGCSRWSSPTRAPSGSCAAPGARRSAWAPSSTCCGSRRPGPTRWTTSRALAARAAPARLRARRDAARRGVRRRRRDRRARRARAGHDLRPAGPSRPARGLARLRQPLAQRLMALRRASTCGSSPTARGGALMIVSLRAGRRDRVAGRRGCAARALPARRRARILLPFTGPAISRRAFEAAVRAIAYHEAGQVVIEILVDRIPVSETIEPDGTGVVSKVGLEADAPRRPAVTSSEIRTKRAYAWARALGELATALHTIF